ARVISAKPVEKLAAEIATAHQPAQPPGLERPHEAAGHLVTGFARHGAPSLTQGEIRVQLDAGQFCYHGRMRPPAVSLLLSLLALCATGCALDRTTVLEDGGGLPDIPPADG